MKIRALKLVISWVQHLVRLELFFTLVICNSLINHEAYEYRNTEKTQSYRRMRVASLKRTPKKI